MQAVPLTVIGGFLGSGKTTLLNHVLTGTTGVRYAVMVNDFGDLAIDEALIKQHDGETISFANGCVCCSLGDNLMQSIDQLLARQPAPEHFLVEVSGVANPKAIADVATLHPNLQRDLIITLVDASSILARKQDNRLSDTVDMQLTPADLIVLNKCDLTTAPELTEVKHYLQSNYEIPLLQTSHAQIPPEVLSQHEMCLNANVVKSKNWRHDPEADFFRHTLTIQAAMTPRKLVEILKQDWPGLLRAKGMIKAAPDTETWCSVQLSSSQVQVQPLPATSAPANAVLVLIGLEPLNDVIRAIEHPNTG